MWRHIVLACAVAALLIPLAAGAQPAAGRFEGKPSKMAPLDKSMQELLDDGWAITGTLSSLALGFLLTQHGKWVMCTVGTTDAAKSTMQTGCYALN